MIPTFLYLLDGKREIKWSYGMLVSGSVLYLVSGSPADSYNGVIDTGSQTLNLLHQSHMTKPVYWLSSMELLEFLKLHIYWEPNGLVENWVTRVYWYQTEVKGAQLKVELPADTTRYPGQIKIPWNLPDNRSQWKSATTKYLQKARQVLKSSWTYAELVFRYQLV